MREGNVKAFGAYLHQAGPYEFDALRLGKKAAGGSTRSTTGQSNRRHDVVEQGSYARRRMLWSHGAVARAMKDGQACRCARADD
jgi:hypothetical protein